MKILKILLYLLLGLAGLLVLLGLFARKDYHIERSIEIDAPKALIYDHVRFFKNFETWSPWAKLDPAMKTTITGTDGAPGATYSWKGNDDVGAGQQVITGMTADRIDMEVRFTEPFESTSPTYLIFEPNEAKTKVTWAFDMHVAFPWNGLAMFTDMDAAVGKDYTQGLENMKAVCEAMAHKKYRGYEIAEVEFPEKIYIGVRSTVPFAEIAGFFAANLPKAFEAAQKNGAEIAGAPSGLYWSYDEQKGETDMAAAVPITENQNFGKGLSVFPVGKGQALLIEYFGSYDSLGNAHYAMDDYMQEKNLQNIPPVIEEYITDPVQEPDTSKWLTRIIYYVGPKTDSLDTPANPPQ
ncbi:MAG: SRPBCC family protein [Lewinellaceae bacterium]|nr:SRPBCC family protein [Lewinellaceae bacterium]